MSVSVHRTLHISSLNNIRVEDTPTLSMPGGRTRHNSYNNKYLKVFINAFETLNSKHNRPFGRSSVLFSLFAELQLKWVQMDKMCKELDLSRTIESCEWVGKLPVFFINCATHLMTETAQKARNEGTDRQKKPFFLSFVRSWCKWCK